MMVGHNEHIKNDEYHKDCQSCIRDVEVLSNLNKHEYKFTH